MPLGDQHVDRTSLMQASAISPRRAAAVSPAARAVLSLPSRRSVRGALLVAALLLLALAFAPRADAAVYWSNGDGTTIGRADNDGTAVDGGFIGGASAPFGVASDGAHV